MGLFCILILLTNNSRDGDNHVTTHAEENETFHAIVFFLYRVVSPLIFVFVIFILLWYIVLSIFR